MVLLFESKHVYSITMAQIFYIYIDRYLMFYTVSLEGQIRAKPNVFLPQLKLSFTLKHIPQLKSWRNLEKTKLNESRRQKLGR